MSESGRRHPRRPSYLGGELPAAEPGSGDPAVRWEIAHRTAQALVDHGRGASDEAIARLVAIADEVGIEELAALWDGFGSDTLPGALWCLYLVREGVRISPLAAAEAFSAGRLHAEVASAIAGVPDPPGPDEIRHLADVILAGAFSGDLALALARAAAYCQTVATGLAWVSSDTSGGIERGLGHGMAMADLGESLAKAAAAARNGKFERADDE